MAHRPVSGTGSRWLRPTRQDDSKSAYSATTPIATRVNIATNRVEDIHVRNDRLDADHTWDETPTAKANLSLAAIAKLKARAKHVARRTEKQMVTKKLNPDVSYQNNVSITWTGFDPAVFVTDDGHMTRNASIGKMTHVESIEILEMFHCIFFKFCGSHCDTTVIFA